ncbi:PEPxxWA-CTERM sorting domain-containing protein [Sandarakinorhabdus sp.]|uniref:PEPxxWA-CTERM sorting domain-containing protein n=1 Tax=Sandarakinorhabdus sp. TaxID=1916663 RepID=UPI0033400FAB
MLCAVFLAAPAAATATITATANSFASREALTWTSIRPSGTITQMGVLASRINAQTSGRSALLGGTAPGGFAAFCIEPLEFLAVGTPVSYNLAPLSRAASGLSRLGIGTAKANLISELFGRNAPNGGFGTMTALTTIAFQLAIWEIVMETPGNRLNVESTSADKGNFYVARTRNTTDAFLTANRWLSELTGTGPRATGLVVLQNGNFGQVGNQDLLAFAGVPEPASWPMLISGFGLVGAALRRRRAAIAA